jgi:hypothetical protein
MGEENQVNLLRFEWVMWFLHRAAGSKIQDYTNELKKVCTLKSVNAAKN